MSKIYFTSDIHLGHQAVLDFDHRPWTTLEEMNEGMIERWNNKVTKQDHVYILGDLCWYTGEKGRSLVERLNGTKHLIRGNHDRVKKACYREVFASIKDYQTLKVPLENGDVKKVVMSHYPMMLYHGHHYGAIHLYGHVHNTIEEQQVRQMIQLLQNQGVNCEMYNAWCGFYNWAPATLDEIMSTYVERRKTCGE